MFLYLAFPVVNTIALVFPGFHVDVKLELGNIERGCSRLSVTPRENLIGLTGAQ